MRNTAYINLKTLLKNAREIKKAIPKTCKFCAVVKADAYGHGACVVANALYKIADCFAVALAEEGAILRESGIDKDILVLSPVYPADYKLIADYSLTASVGGMEDAHGLGRYARRVKTHVIAHIKFDSGMKRAGTEDIEEVAEIMKYSRGNPYLNIGGIYSHFADAEDVIKRENALNKFLLANKVVKSYNINAISHISASGGLLKGVYLDMVRIGILLYGYKPFPSDKVKVSPVMKIYAPVVGHKRLKKGDYALYGDCRTKEDKTVSLIRYGYADGLPRNKVSGQFNNRCMDLTAIDGEYSHAYAVLEDADKTAEKYGTISYEILTKAALRADKKYIR